MSVWVVFAAVVILGFAALAMSARQDAEEAHRELIALLAEQARQKDDDEIRNNIGV